jgi:predicted O-methyltransferase YrrM
MADDAHVLSMLGDPRLAALLDRLHAQSLGQDETMGRFFSARAAASEDLSPDSGVVKAFLTDKLVALERDKALFCYQLCRALGARRVVEAGTSYGVSTLYLAAAVRANGGGIVIGTEYEPEKVEAARANFAEAGLADLIDLRDGDLRETLADLADPVDFMLIDIWTPMARPALERVAPHLRAGAVVICDNTGQYRDYYRDYFDFLADPANRFITMTLPFEGGLEMSVKV